MPLLPGNEVASLEKGFRLSIRLDFGALKLLGLLRGGILVYYARFSCCEEMDGGGMLVLPQLLVRDTARPTWRFHFN